MKFYIDGKIVTSDDYPLIVILTDKDKRNIANRIEGATVYCLFDEEKHPFNEIDALTSEAKEAGK